MFIKTCRTVASEQTDSEKVRKLHAIADAYNVMLERWFDQGENHQDLPGRTIGSSKKFIANNKDNLEEAMRDLALSLIEVKGGEVVNTPKGFICIVERPDGTTYEQEFEVVSTKLREQLEHCQKILGPKSKRNSYWAVDGYYIW